MGHGRFLSRARDGTVVLAASTALGAVGSIALCAFPRSWVRWGPSLSLGEAGMGVWGKTWNRAVILRGRGGSGFSPSAFPDWSPLLSVYSCSRAVVFPTSTTLLFEGLRSGTRRRRGASASAQAGGGTGPETRRTVPAHAGAVLYGQCAAAEQVVCGAPVALLEFPRCAVRRTDWAS